MPQRWSKMNFLLILFFFLAAEVRNLGLLAVEVEVEPEVNFEVEVGLEPVDLELVDEPGFDILGRKIIEGC